MPQPTLPPSEPLDQTTDLPESPSVEAGPSTTRRADTSANATPATLNETGAFEAGTTPGDDSSVTGGYTPGESVATETIVPGYQILGELGRGGMGVVYKARQASLDRVVALKMILAGPHASSTILTRFQAEAHAVARLQHPNIVQIHEVGWADGMPFLSLEFVDGGSLSAQVAHEPQTPTFAAQMTETLSRAMQYAHERGIVHRDLKPSNVLLTADGTPKITDFGLAKRIEGESGQTQTGAVLGTPSYMAPEQAMSELDKIGPKSDVYALGAVLYDLLTGRPPFSGSSMLDTLEMVRSREPVPPGQLAAKLPRDLETICLKCLQKDPARRYATAGELADDLRRFLEGRPIVARPVSAVAQVWRWAKRNPKVAGLGTAVALLLVAVAAVTSVMSYRLNIKKKEAEEAAYNESIAKDKVIEEQQAKEEARALKDTAQAQRDKAHATTMQTIRNVLLPVDGVMRDHPKLVPLRLTIFAAILQHLDELRDQASNNPLEDRTEAGTYARIGDIYLKGGRVQDAHEQLNKAHQLLKSKVDDNPNDATALHNLAAIINQSADVEWRLGNGPKARDMYVEALEIRRRRIAAVEALLKQRPPGASQGDLSDAKEALAKQYGFIGFADLRLGDNAQAIANYMASDREFAGLPRGSAGSLRVRRMRAEAQVRLGDAQLRLGKADAANDHYQKALNQRQELLRITPRPPSIVLELKSEVALSRIYYADFLLAARQDVPAAFGQYVQALKLFDEQVQAGSESLELLRRTAAVLYRLGVCAGQLPLPSLTQRTLAMGSFGECLRMRTQLAAIDPTDTQSKAELMLVLARVGRAADAEKVADALRTQAGNDPQVLFQVTCGLAIVSEGAGPVADRCRTKAFATLATLIDKGWKDAVPLTLDPDLAALRADDRFSVQVKRISK